jgi:hypothetical protein
MISKGEYINIMHTMLPFLFSVYKGGNKLQKSEISENTYVTLKAPVYISVMIFVVGVAISIYSVFNQVNTNTEVLKNKLSVSEYRQDRITDSLKNDRYRKETQDKLDEIIKRLEQLHNPSPK